VITDNNTQLRFNIEDSKNCGGNCNATQSGTAITNITVGEKDVFLNLEFFGIGELQESNYEKIKFTLDDQMIADVEVYIRKKTRETINYVENNFFIDKILSDKIKNLSIPFKTLKKEISGGSLPSYFLNNWYQTTYPKNPLH
jgi:hypothetical protein